MSISWSLGKLWKVWEGPRKFVRFLVRFREFQSVWEGFGAPGKVLEHLGVFWGVWEQMGGFKIIWEGFREFEKYLESF